LSKIEWTDARVASFWSYVDVRGFDECWKWRGGLFTNGYGQFRLGAHKVKAHRCAYELTRGPLNDLRALHRCDYPPCCNPVHLFSGTDADNSHDRDAKGRTRNGIVSLPGERNPAAKLTLGDVAEIRRLASCGIPQRRLASIFAVSQSQVGNIVRRQAWA